MPSEAFIPLTELLVHGRLSSTTVAWYRGQQKCWDDFTFDIARLADQIRQRPEIRWGLYLDESYEFVVALLALLHTGKVPVLPGNNRPGNTKKLLSEVDILLGDFDSSERCYSFYQLMDSVACESVGFSLLDDQQTLEIFTSGSTGEPKAEVKQLHQLTAELATLHRHWGEALGATTVAATVSHQHIYGLLFKVLWPLTAGNAFVSRSYRDPQSLLEDASAYSQLVWVASPAHLKRLHQALPWSKAKDHLVDIFSSGGPLPEQCAHLLDEWYGKPPLEIYGSTESGGIAWRRQCRGETAALWQPFEGVILSQGDGGQLQVRSPHLMPGVLLETADAVSFSADGEFQLKGRLDRIVKIEEKRLSLPELETALRCSTLVADARAVPLVQSGCQLLGIVVELSESGSIHYTEVGKSALVKQLKSILAESFEAVVLPRQWRFVAALPVNEQGKIQQREIVTLFEKQPKILPLVLAEQQDDNQHKLVLQIEKDLDYFPGHFPTAAILPGVVQVGWAEYFGRQYFALQNFVSMEKLKFQSILRPSMQVVLYLQYDEAKQTLQFRFESTLGVHSQGRLKFG